MLATVAPPAPPGPPPPRSLAEVRQDALRFVLENGRRYGDVFRYTLDGSVVTLLNHPQAIQHVLRDNHHIYQKKDSPDYLMHRHILGEGLLTSEGEEWLRLRRLMEPAFHRRVIAAAGEMMVQTTQRMLDEWEPLVGTGRTLDLAPALSQLALTIVTKALFDYDITAAADRFSTAVQTLNQALGQGGAGQAGAYHHMPAAIATIRDMVSQIVAYRRTRPAVANDFLALLLASGELSDRQVRDQIITLLLAGHETTAKAMSWTLYLLSQHPAVEERVCAEIATVLGGATPTVEGVEQLPYTWQVIQEALRLYPPVWILSRRATATDEVLGYEIPAGSTILVSPYAMHRHPQYWPEPERFEPERLQAARPVQPFTYLPFGGGPRLCIGRNFATLEMKLVLVTILQRYRLRLRPGHPVVAEGLVSLNPRYGLPMILHEVR